LTIFVTKADGARQPFDREKVIGTCLKMGATREIAESIAREIEAGAGDGIKTKKIIKMIHKQLGKYNPTVKNQIDLREALSLMEPKPDFERFVQTLLGEHGYEVTPNQIVKGKCVEHEIDAVASKDGKNCIVEVKHHYNQHTLTNLDVSRISRAVFEDLTEGFELGTNNLRIDKALIVCNTKFSNEARRYAKCRGIDCIGWSYPPKRDLQTLIEEKKLYPVTCIKGLDARTRQKLSLAGIILLRQLIEKDPQELRKETGIGKEILEQTIKKARVILP
jgi:hypothetical protein